MTALARPLSGARLALVTTAGIHLRGDRQFVAKDQTFRAIPSEAGPGDLLQSHTSIGFDRTAFQGDPNIVYPVDRLRELVAAGEVGSLGPTCYSFLGAQYPPYEGLTSSATEVARLLRADGVQVVLLTGT